ncbi:MAG TPA: hypothetical protein PLB55_17635 [Prosthecobacter sp.]|nr:hypothetical protein [Prosthecobacter sp.]
MQFDKAAYKTAKERIISLIKSSHDWENTEGFIADGVICPDVYEKQPLRILCILAESYGYDGNKVEDIEDQLRTDLMGLAKPRVQTPKKLATLLHLIQRSVETGTKVSRDEWREMPEFFRALPENTVILQEALSKVAWINVKKASRAEGTKMDAEEVYDHAKRNEHVLREQIQSIAPNLIFVCGRVPFQSLLDMDLLGSGVQSDRLWNLQESKNGTWVIEISHPAFPRDWRSYDNLFRNYEQLLAQMALLGALR